LPSVFSAAGFPQVVSAISDRIIPLCVDALAPLLAEKPAAPAPAAAVRKWQKRFDQELNVPFNLMSIPQIPSRFPNLKSLRSPQILLTTIKHNRNFKKTPFLNRLNSLEFFLIIFFKFFSKPLGILFCKSTSQSPDRPFWFSSGR